MPSVRSISAHVLRPVRRYSAGRERGLHERLPRPRRLRGPRRHPGATGEFAEVGFPAPLDASSIGADRSPLAIIVPTEWAEQPDSSSGAMIRHVSFTLTLVARHETPSERFRMLDRLTSIAQNTIEGSTLGGGCAPARTRLRRGVYDLKSRHPELRITIEGEFCYAIPSAVEHSVSA